LSIKGHIALCNFGVQPMHLAFFLAPTPSEKAAAVRHRLQSELENPTQLGLLKGHQQQLVLY
jgi:hypothetical protein